MADPKLRELLLFYADSGADEALAEEAADRFAESAQATKAPAREQAQPEAQPTAQPASHPAPPRPERPSPRPAAMPDEAQVQNARELARQAASLADLRACMEAFEGCNLRYTAKQLVFADGNPKAEIMFVGEAPGRDEDIEGLPFVGRSGRLLDRMLAAIGLDRQSAYITNVIPWRPPGNRTPTPFETEICRPFIERHIELIGPRVLVPLGGPSAKLLLGATTGILKLRGKWSTHQTPDGRRIDAMPSLHPAYLLRNPAHKKLAWRDFLEIKGKLESKGMGD